METISKRLENATSEQLKNGIGMHFENISVEGIIRDFGNEQKE